MCRELKVLCYLFSLALILKIFALKNTYLKSAPQYLVDFSTSIQLRISYQNGKFEILFYDERLEPTWNVTFSRIMNQEFEMTMCHRGCWLCDEKQILPLDDSCLDLEPNSLLPPFSSGMKYHFDTSCLPLRSYNVVSFFLYEHTIPGNIHHNYVTIIIE